IAVFLIAGWLLVIVGFGSDQPTSQQNPEEADERAQWDEKYSEPREFIKLNWRSGMPYKETRRLITNDKLPLLHEMLEDKKYAGDWHKIARLIGYVSDDPNSVPVLLRYFQRDDSWNWKGTGNHAVGYRRLSGKIDALQWIGKLGGDESGTLLSRAVTEDGAAQVAKAWLADKLIPDSSTFGAMGNTVVFIRGRAAMGLVFTRKPENVAIVRDLATKEITYCAENQKYTRLYSPLVSAMVYDDFIEDHDLESLFNLFGSRERRKALRPYIRKYKWQDSVEEDEEAKQAAGKADVPEDVEKQAKELFHEKVVAIRQRDVSPLVSRLCKSYKFYNVTIHQEHYKAGFGPEKTYPMALGKKAFKLSKPEEIVAFLTGLDKPVGSEWEVLERVFVFAELLDRQVRTHMPNRRSRIKRFAEQKPEDWQIIISGTDAGWRAAATLMANPRVEICSRYEFKISEAGQMSIVSERLVYQYAALE
ncbi:MAG: hypothetical protein ACYS29_06770, partial [Planctomycetota bacterium]